MTLAITLLGAAAPVSLGGVLPIDEATVEHWKPCGAWCLPVGHPRNLGRGFAPGEPGFELNRGVERTKGHVTHQGADLADGRGGDTVRAAASGLVLIAFDGDNGNGYGGYVVLAHRLEDESIAYTVYAHLAEGTLEVRPGEFVGAGDALALVGDTGRATTPHLHFEVRRPADPGRRWEKARVVDPLRFVAARFDGPPGEKLAGLTGKEIPRKSRHKRAPPSEPDLAAAPYFAWARRESLLAGEADFEDKDSVLARANWWRMLTALAQPAGARAGASEDEIRDELIDVGLIPELDTTAPVREPVSWPELARDLRRLHKLGIRPPQGPLFSTWHRRECLKRFADRRPATHTAALERLSGRPTLDDACVLLADAGGPRAGSKRSPAHAAAHHRTAPRGAGTKPAERK